MSTTVVLTPATDTVRMCAKHPDRKASSVRTVKASKPVPHTAYVPECAECSKKRTPTALGVVVKVRAL